MITAFVNSVAVETFIIGTEMQLHADVVLWVIALCYMHFQAGGRRSRPWSKCCRPSSTDSPDLHYLISVASVATISASVALPGSVFPCAISPTTVKNFFSSNTNVLYLIQTWFFLQHSWPKAYKITTTFILFFQVCHCFLLSVQVDLRFFSFGFALQWMSSIDV